MVAKERERRGGQRERKTTTERCEDCCLLPWGWGERGWEAKDFKLFTASKERVMMKKSSLFLSCNLKKRNLFFF